MISLLFAALTFTPIQEDMLARVHIPKDCKAATYADKDGMPSGNASMLKDHDFRKFLHGSWIAVDCKWGKDYFYFYDAGVAQ